MYVESNGMARMDLKCCGGDPSVVKSLRFVYDNASDRVLAGLAGLHSVVIRKRLVDCVLIFCL